VPRVVFTVALLALHVYVFMDVVKAPSQNVRTLPKALWLFVSLFPLLGPLLWVLGGRPLVGPGYGGEPGGGSGGTRPGPRPGRGPLAPDDDPEFLKRLDEQSWAARMERLRRERQSVTGGPPPDDQMPDGRGQPDPPPPDQP
jgi:Phospholipase_D-nuclease N-terminal